MEISEKRVRVDRGSKKFRERVGRGVRQRAEGHERVREVRDRDDSLYVCLYVCMYVHG